VDRIDESRKADLKLSNPKYEPFIVGFEEWNIFDASTHPFCKIMADKEVAQRFKFFHF